MTMEKVLVNVGDITHAKPFSNFYMLQLNFLTTGRIISLLLVRFIGWINSSTMNITSLIPTADYYNARH